ncbi:helix-turn-helix transcriptional regulator [Pseudonocardia sp.]|uniref:helix-turn-helix domain-containing protein n=1 Tax=Pseudonocardia sp. TaxID=60912 RepID=UPI002638634C|nr:helix-turn-helix transcriptional regulator [Pseudonocardia sp.]
MGVAGQDGLRIACLTTGERIRITRESRGMTRPVVAGLVGRSPDWLKKIESGVRPLNSLPLLIELARTLGVADLSELTGDDFDAPVSVWEKDVHHVVPAIRDAMREVSFGSTSDATVPTVVDADDLSARVRRLWLLWHRSSRQRSEVGAALPALIRQAHASMRATEGDARRRCRAATADLYRLVQRLLAHICEPELHALAVERGRALSEDADTPISLAQAAWASSVGLCASGHHEAAAQLADDAATELLRSCGDDLDPAAMGTVGALQLEAAAAHALAGHEGNAYRYLDAAAASAARMPSGTWHLPSAFDRTNVEILAVIVGVSLRRPTEAVRRANRIDLRRCPSVVRRSRLLLECATAHANRREFGDAVRSLGSATTVSAEAVALIPWARTLADELAERAPRPARAEAERLRSALRAVG